MTKLKEKNKMEQKILDRLEENLYKKYKTLNEGTGFLFIENYDGIIVLNWSPLNDLYINYTRVNQIKKYMRSFLEKNKQEGLFFVGDLCCELR